VSFYASFYRYSVVLMHPWKLEIWNLGQRRIALLIYTAFMDLGSEQREIGLYNLQFRVVMSRYIEISMSFLISMYHTLSSKNVFSICFDSLQHSLYILTFAA